jgi:hypothetical protein
LTPTGRLEKQTSVSAAAMTDLTHAPDCDVIVCYGGAKLGTFPQLCAALTRK